MSAAPSCRCAHTGVAAGSAFGYEQFQSGQSYRRCGMMAEAKISRLKNRHLSPHLQIYKPLLTMMMSIVHRITGAALFFGMLLLVWVLIAAAAGPNAYASVQWFMETLLGRLILVGYTWALIHHMLGGINNLIWDLGYGFGPVEFEWLTVATLVGSVGFTVLIWTVGYFVMGGIR